MKNNVIDFRSGVKCIGEYPTEDYSCQKVWVIKEEWMRGYKILAVVSSEEYAKQAQIFLKEKWGKTTSIYEFYLDVVWAANKEYYDKNGEGEAL